VDHVNNLGHMTYVLIGTHAYIYSVVRMAPIENQQKNYTYASLL